MILRARHFDRGLLEESRVTSDPTLRTVFTVDLVSVTGDVIAGRLSKRTRAFLLGYPGVAAIRWVLFTFVGPGQVWVVARVDIDNDLRGDEVTSLVRGIESGMKDESENVYRVGIVPIGGTPVVNI